MPTFPKAAGNTERVEWPPANHKLGGLNLRDDPSRIAAHQFTRLKNVLTRKGIPSRRLGYGTVLTSKMSAELVGLSLFQKSDDTTWLVAFKRNSADYYSGETGSMSGYTVGTPPFRTAQRKRARQYGDKLYIVEGQNGVVEWDGTTWKATTPNTAADNGFGTTDFQTVRYVAAAFDRVVFAGSSTYPQYVWISQLGDPSYCKTTMVVKIDTQDGQDITGLVEWGKYILVPKERSFHAIPAMDPTDTAFRVVQVSAHVGCPSGESLTGYGSAAFFLGNDRRVYRVHLGQIADDLKLVPISGLIQTELDKLSSVDLYQAEAVVWDDYYVLAAGGKWFVLDLLTSDLRSEDGANWAVLEHPTALRYLFVHPIKGELYSGDVNGNIFVHWRNGAGTEYQNDNGTAIDWDWETGWLSTNTPERTNLFTQLHAEFGASKTSQVYNLVMTTDAAGGTKTYTVDSVGSGFALGTDVLGTGVLGFSAPSVRLNATPPSTGRRWRFRAYRGSDTDATRVERITLYLRRLQAF